MTAGRAAAVERQPGASMVIAMDGYTKTRHTQRHTRLPTLREVQVFHRAKSYYYEVSM